MNRDTTTMNRDEAKIILPFVTALAEGRQVQTLDFNEGDWTDIDVITVDYFLSHPLEYRIKPESKYRPFKNAEECWEEMQKHKPFGWIKHKNDPVNTHIGVAEVRSGGLYLSGPRSGVLFNFKEAFDALTFADNTPFGMKE